MSALAGGLAAFFTFLLGVWIGGTFGRPIHIDYDRLRRILREARATNLDTKGE